jgi:hypothetical protein
MATRPARILELLHRKQEDFRRFGQQSISLIEKYRRTLNDLDQLTGDPAIIEPLTDLGLNQGLIASRLSWGSREESLAWVRDRIGGVSTFAVDGSQIYPSKDLSIPIALVQIGWFENQHLSSGGYEKNINLDILTPTDLRDLQGELADRKVNMRRFEMETQRLVEYMEEHQGDPNCLVFLDGSLIATFAESFDAATQAFYVKCLLQLLRASAICRVPIVGYIDTSYACDLVALLQRTANLPPSKSLHDSQLLQGNWGDRSPLFLAQRDILTKAYEDQAEQILYCYVKTNAGPAVRLELPRWIYDKGRFPQVLDWVLCEVIVGGGYPYAIETADQVAVLRSPDRQAFFAILQDWAKDQEINLQLSRKMVSKLRRR